MAAMTTALTEFSNTVNSRTSTIPGHTAVRPRLVIEKRRVPEGNQTTLEYGVKVIFATEGADGMVLQQKVSLDMVVRYPVLGKSTDVAAALAVIRDIIAGDEFANSVSTQEWL